MRFITIINGCKELVQILASYVSYDNSTSGLSATDVQSAIDELASNGGSVDQCLDGGFANSVYTPEQCFDAGGA